MFSNAQHKNGWLCILQQLMINTVGYGACEKSTLFSENTWQSFKTCIWLVTVLLATMQAAENSHIPSVGRPGFQLWTHTQILAAFWTNSQFPRTQFQLPPTWEANNIAERPTCIQLNAHNILLWESGCFRSVKTHSYTPFCGVIRYSDDFIQMSMIKYINRRFVFNYPGNGYLTFIPSLLHFYSVIAQIHFWKGSAL